MSEPTGQKSVCEKCQKNPCLCGLHVLPIEWTEPYGEIVKFEEAQIDVLEKVTLTNGIIIQLEEGRRVEVWKVMEEEGFCVRIFRPTNDGKTSKLMFGLKPQAAEALCVALSRHVFNR